MQSLDVVVETPLSRSARVRQLEGMFDVPPSERASLRFTGELDIDEADWNVGLIVGPSGSGKSTVMQRLFGKEKKLRWNQPSVVDDFSKEISMEEIAKVCQAVGFNTVPAWMRPFKVLSNGEKFRVELARRLLELPDPIVVDEFTSVVDRQVAKIGSHAVQKYVRRNNRRFVAVTCHYDVIDWLQPDWVFEPATSTFTRRRLRRRPNLKVEIARVERKAWDVFAPYHYLTAELPTSAQCFVAFVDGRMTSIAGMMHRVHPRTRDIIGCSRLVTLPDWQGMGLAMVLIDAMGAAYKAIGKRLHTYPAHPALVHTFDRSPEWSMIKRPGVFKSHARGQAVSSKVGAGFGGRPNATFAYAGDMMPDRDAARELIEGKPQ